MRSYLIDELTEDQTNNVVKQLEAMSLQSGMEGIYWLPIPHDLHNEIQLEHAAKCGPHVMALEVAEGSICLELLVRAKNALHCNCVGYAQGKLEQHMMRYVDGLLSQD